VGYVPFDYRRSRWCRKGDWKWQAFPVAPDQLPELVGPAQEVGRVAETAARDTGLPAGLPIIAAGADKTCEFLGAGCLRPESAGLSYGTTATIGTYTKKYIEVIPYIPPYPSAIPGIFNTEFQIYRGFWLVSWFKKEFGSPEVERALKEGVEPEVFLEELLDQAPPGSLGLMLQPTWSPGVKIPGPEAKGSIIGFGDAHTRAHLYRAIIEGLCYGLKDGGERIQKRSGVKFREVRVSGGGSQSPGTLQITADIFNLPVLKPRMYDTAALGAAMDAAVGTGLHPDFETAVDRMTHVASVIEPDRHRAAYYHELYHEVYRHIYEKLEPYYKKIRKITGYPD
jgi:sugar (pentulose or hexulose) kinase